MTQDELAAILFDPGGLAPMLGWETLHVRPGIRAGGRWWTATVGSMSHWPDWTLVRPRDRRILFVELVLELKQPTPEQVRVLDVLEQLVTVGRRDGSTPAVDVAVWRPSDARDPLERSNAYQVLR